MCGLLRQAFYVLSIVLRIKDEQGARIPEYTDQPNLMSLSECTGFGNNHETRRKAKL